MFWNFKNTLKTVAFTELWAAPAIYNSCIVLNLYTQSKFTDISGISM